MLSKLSLFHSINLSFVTFSNEHYIYKLLSSGQCGSIKEEYVAIQIIQTKRRSPHKCGLAPRTSAVLARSTLLGIILFVSLHV